MNKKVTLIGGCFFGTIILFWLVSNYIAPLSEEHGQYVAYAKFISQGLMPYQDFNMVGTPIGIYILSILYSTIGIEASSYWASGLLCLIHFINGYFLWKIMKKTGIEPIYSIIGLLFYAFITYSSDCIIFNFEPFSTCFILGACLFILNQDKWWLIGATICFVLALGCKEHTLFLLPVLTFLIYDKSQKEKSRSINSMLFIVTSLLIAIIGYTGITIIANNPQWANDLFPLQEMKHEQTWIDVLYYKLTYIIIQGGRCSLFFLIACPWLWKKMNFIAKKYVLTGIIACICYAGVFLFKIEVSNGMLFYPFIVLALVHILQSIPNRKLAINLGIVAIIAPFFLTIREFQQLEWGKVKTEQQEVLQELDVLKAIIKKPGTVFFKFDKYKDYYQVPHVFAELPLLRPTKDTIPMEKADYIILTEGRFLELAEGENAEAFLECIADRKSYVSSYYLVYVR